MADLYQRKGGILSAPTVNKPIEQNNIISNISSGMASYMQQKANENFALGSRKLVDDVIQQSYQMNPTNSKQFMENVETNILKISRDLNIPDEYKEKMLDVVNKQVKGYNAKINQNLEKQIENQNKNLVTESYNSAISGQEEFYRGKIEAIINKDKESYDAFDVSYNNLKSQAENLMTNALDKNGNSIIKQNAVKKIDKKDIILDFIYGLDYEGLKNFDEVSFQDRKRFKEQADIENDEYDSIESKLKSRLKELNKEHERVVKSQSEYNAVIQAKTYNEDEVQKLIKGGYITSEDAKALKKYSKMEVNEALMLDEDENFLNQLSLMADLSQSKDDGSKDYNKKLIKTYAETLNNLEKYTRENGTSYDISDSITNIAINSATNQLFADATSKLYDDNTALGTILKDYKNKEKGANLFTRSYWRIQSSMTEDKMEKAQKYVNKEASQGTRKVLARANQLVNPFITEEQKKQINIEIDKIIAETNKNIIISKYTGLIPRSDIEKAEKNLKEGKSAFITYNNTVYNFKGFTNKDLILERK